ncbi:MAG: hypothetical protein IIA67_12775 [Planctomycetes bacterium]|nr:hypothetical protein [Planctomycetota bacterium]
MISALEQANDSRLLANPNVTVLNNETAVLESIKEIPFQQLTQTGQGGNIGTIGFREAGIRLKVTARAAADGTVLLEVEPSFSRVAGTTDSGSGEQPIIDKSSAKTIVRVASGQTMVIGGLRQRSDVGGFNGVPFLKDLWLIGPLFRGESTTVRESELIVFITPEIITQPTIDQPRHERAIGVGREMLSRVPQGRLPFVQFQDDCRLPPVDVEFSEGGAVLEPPPVISPPPSVPEPRNPPVRGRTKPQQQPKEAATPAKPQAARPKATYLTPQPRADRRDTKEKGPDLGRASRRPTYGGVSRLPSTDRTHAETQRPSRRVEAPSWQAPSQQAHRVNRWSEKIGSRPADRSRSPEAMKSSAGPAVNTPTPANRPSRWEAPGKRPTRQTGEPAAHNPYEAIRTTRRLRHDPADRSSWIDDMFLP